MSCLRGRMPTDFALGTSPALGLLPLCLLPAAVLLLAAPAPAQSGCSLSADVNTVSVTSGAFQTLTLSTNPPLPGETWYLAGSITGTSPADAYFAYGGLQLARDRYMLLVAAGRSPLLPGGAPGFLHGHQGVLDGTGSATQHVVVPPALASVFVGRTVHHGFFRLSHVDLLPYCGSNTQPLTFAP